MRAVLGTIVGYAIWTAIWLTGNQLLFAEVAAAATEGGRVDDAGTLAGLLGLSVACSVAGGLVAALAGGPSARAAVRATAVLLVLTGVAVQVMWWDAMPVWYHASFLVLLAPVTLGAGRLVPRRAGGG